MPTPPRPQSQPQPAAAHDWRVSRRAVLAGGISTLALAACGSSSKGAAPTRSLLPFFDQNSYLTAGSVQRACFGIGDAQGAILSDTPAELSFRVQRTGGRPATLRVARYAKGLPRAYFPLVFRPDAPGDYTVTTTVDGEKLTSTFTVGAAGSNPVPGPGQAMPSLATPTTSDPRGVDPICTRDPVCPFHAVSLDAALGLQRPVAFLVSTPKFCQVAICGPVLDVLVGARDAYAGRITFIHQEVYRSATEAAEKGSAAALAPALDALHLTFEPSLFLVGPKGLIERRLDLVYDATELDAALHALVG